MPELDEWREMVKQLAQPFDTMDFLPRAASGGQALGLPYIDARDVQRRLDAVVGANWSFDFDVLSADGKMVKGILTVNGVTRCDAGEASQEDEPLKSAVSDALKRCAVHFGIGRYLYYLPKVWAPFDSQKRRFTEAPRFDPKVIRRAVALAISDVAPESGGDLQAQAQPKPPANTERVQKATEKEPSYARATVERPQPPRQPAPQRQQPEQTTTEQAPAEGRKIGAAVWTAWGNLAVALGVEKSDRDSRITIWSGMLDRKLTTGNEITEAEERTLIRLMNERRMKELKEQAAAKRANQQQADYGPFDDTPEHPRSALATGA